jgi:hypothetical protein
LLLDLAHGQFYGFDAFAILTVVACICYPFYVSFYVSFDVSFDGHVCSFWAATLKGSRYE